MVCVDIGTLVLCASEPCSQPLATSKFDEVSNRTFESKPAGQYAWLARARNAGKGARRLERAATETCRVVRHFFVVGRRPSAPGHDRLKQQFNLPRVAVIPRVRQAL